MHLDNVGLAPIVISLNYDASLWKISSRWSVQFLDESLPFCTDNVSIKSHPSIKSFKR